MTRLGLCTVAGRDRNRDRLVRITGRQASLRAVQQEGQEEKYKEGNLTRTRHAFRLARKLGDLNAGRFPTMASAISDNLFGKPLSLRSQLVCPELRKKRGDRENVDPIAGLAGAWRQADYKAFPNSSEPGSR
jgi:hypothetical protein